MKWRDIPRSYTDRLTELQAQLAKDPYSVLGLDASATDDELKRAYRAKVRAYHPDTQGTFLRAHAQEVLKVINAAYERIQALRNQ